MNSEARKRLREQRPCPTCSGRTRETVGMICQTCGTDFAPHPATAAAVEVFRGAWERADANGWSGNRVDAGIRALLDAGWIPPRDPWLWIFLSWLYADAPGPLDFQGNPIPDRLACLLQDAYGDGA